MECNLRVDVNEVVYVFLFNYENARLLRCGNKTIVDESNKSMISIKQ